MSTPTLVLVHGAWGGAWCWRDLIQVLDDKRVPYLTLDLASSRVGASITTDLSDDARALVAASNIGAPVVLVGHSYGGAVISEAAHRIERLEGLVYIAALIPEIGESATDCSRRVRVRTELDSAIRLDGEILKLEPDLVPSALYGRCTKSNQDWATSMLSTQTLASFRQVRSGPDCAAPSLYIRCLDDRAVDPSLQELLSIDCDETVDMDSDHSPFLSNPQRLAELLIEWER